MKFSKQFLNSNKAVSALSCLTILASLASCTTDNEELSTNDTALQTTTQANLSFLDSEMVGEVETPTISELDVTTCMDGAAGSIEGFGDPSGYYVLFDLDGNVVEPNSRSPLFDPQVSVSNDGSFEISELENGTYTLVAFEGRIDVFNFLRNGIDVPQSEPITITLECPSDFNNSPVTESFDLGRLPLGETRVIDVLANSFDADGDELTITLGNFPSQGTYELTDAGEIIVTRTGQGAGGVIYTVSDGNGGTAQGSISFSNIGADI